MIGIADPTDRRLLVALLAAAAAVRVVGLSSPGHAGDVRAFELWAEGLAQHGLSGYYGAGGDANYPAMLYLLWPLGVALDGQALWLAIRALSIPFDLALGALLYGVGLRLGPPAAAPLAAALYLLNPAVVLSGPAWGQVDGMGALPMVASLVAVAGGGLVAAGALAVLAGLVKPQFGIAGFVLAGLAVSWLRSRGGLRDAAILGLAGVLTFTVILMPLALDPLAYRAVMTDTFGRYPYASHYAFNPWAIAFGFGAPDGPWLVVGTVLAVAGIVASLLLLRWRRDLVGLLAVGALIGLAIYYLPTRVHERYLYGAIVLLAPLAAARPALRLPFAALSVAFLATLVTVIASSPYDILPLPDRLRGDIPRWWIVALSVATIGAGTWCARELARLVREPARVLAPAGRPSAGPGPGS